MLRCLRERPQVLRVAWQCMHHCLTDVPMPRLRSEDGNSLVCRNRLQSYRRGGGRHVLRPFATLAPALAATPLATTLATTTLAATAGRYGHSSARRQVM